MAARQAQVDALATPSTATATTARRPSTSSTTVTAPEERIEFECYRGQKINNNDDSQESDGGKKSLESTSSNELESSLDDIEFIDGGSSDNDGFAEAVSCTTTEDETDNDEELWSEFSQVLENTLAKGSTCSSDDISEQQAVKWIDIFNRRASLLKQQSTPQTPDSVYFTPKQRRSDETPIREFFTPATPVRPRLSQTRMKSFESPDADETLKFDSDSHSTLPSSSAGTYTTIISTSDDYTSKKPSIFDSMPSMQRATLSLGSRHRSRSPPPPIPAHVSPPRSFDTTPKRPLGMMAKLYNNSIPENSTAASKIGASESQKEANIINKMKKLRMRTNERRATVGIDFGTNQSLLEEAKEREKEIQKREKVFEEKKQQQNAINSGTTTTIEILDNTTSTSKPIFYTPTDSKPSNGKHQTRYSDPDKRKERRLRSRTTGIQKDHLQEAMKKISPALVASPKNIKKVQKQAEKILKRQECERQRTAQDVQRGLDETENRIAEVQTVGKELETALIKDPKNNWLLENWLLYVQELRQLKLREDDLNRRVKEISISDEYHKLRGQLNEIQQDLQPGEIGPNILIEKEIMNKIVAVLDEHQKIRDEMDQSMRHSRKTVFDIQKILNEKNYNFSNFDPIFTSNFTPTFDIFC
uniref:BMERB domain-containing protein n=1 Tax=Panagrolaimus davidi TaxID=227884 RepID=A0A914P5X4_9BILA